MPQNDPSTDESNQEPDGDEANGPSSHRAPRPGMAKRWAVGAAGVAVLAVGLLISPAIGTDGKSAPAPAPTPTASPASTPKATAAATTTPRSTTGSVPTAARAADDVVVAKRMDDALKVVREKGESVSAKDTKVDRDDSTGTITIVTKPAETYTGSRQDLVSSLLDAIELDIDVDVVPAAPGVSATLDLQPIAISLGLG